MSTTLNFIGGYPYSFNSGTGGGNFNIFMRLTSTVTSPYVYVIVSNNSTGTVLTQGNASKYSNSTVVWNADSSSSTSITHNFSGINVSSTHWQYTLKVQVRYGDSSSSYSTATYYIPSSIYIYAYLTGSGSYTYYGVNNIWVPFSSVIADPTTSSTGSLLGWAGYSTTTNNGYILTLNNSGTLPLMYYRNIIVSSTSTPTKYFYAVWNSSAQKYLYYKTGTDTAQYGKSSYVMGSVAVTNGTNYTAWNKQNCINAGYNITRPGYQFYGWSWSNLGGYNLVFGGTYTGGTHTDVAYPYWYATTYSYNFYSGTVSCDQYTSNTLVSTVSVGHDSGYTMPTAASLGLSKSGYTFKGWSITYTDGGQIDYGSGVYVSVNSNLNFYPCWEKTISSGSISVAAYPFESSPGTALMARIKATGDYLNITDYRLSIYVNNSWIQYWTFTKGTDTQGGVTYQYYVNPSLGSDYSSTWGDITLKVTSPTMGASWSTTKVAHMNQNVYDATYFKFDSTRTQRGYLRVGQTIPSGYFPSNPSYTGYTFGGWQWGRSAAPSYSPTIQTGLGSGSKVFCPAGLELTSGSYYADGFGVWYTATYTMYYSTGSLWTSNSSTWYPDGGITAQQSYTYGVSQTTMDSATTAGWGTFKRSNGTSSDAYNILGLATTDGGSKVYNFGQSITLSANKTVYPYWSIKTYTISYYYGTNTSGQSNTLITTQTKTCGTSLTLLKTSNVGVTLTRNGYIHNGWSLNADGSTKDYYSGDTYYTDAAMTLYPYWLSTTYTMTYKPGDTDASPQTEYSESITVGQDITLRGATYTKTTHNQTGWYVFSNDGGFGMKTDLGKTINCSWYGNTVVTPIWTEKVYYTASFYNGTSLYTTLQSPENGGNITLPAAPEKTDYIGQWAVGSSTGTKYNAGAAYNLTSNTNFYVVYTQKESTISYYIDGTYYSEDKGVPGYSHDLITPVKAGYTFDGWYTNSSYTGTKYTSYNFPSHGTTVAFYGKFNVIPTQIQYNIDGETSIVDSGTPDTAATLITPSTITGYTFDGWYSDSEYTNKIASIKYPAVAAAPIIVYGRYLPNDYEINYSVTNGNLSFESKTVKYNSAIGDFPVVTSNQGYSWSGEWYNDLVKVTTEMVCKGDINLSTECYPNEYQIIFDVNADNVESISNMTISYDQPIGDLPIPERTDYIFLGWYLDGKLFEQVGEKYNWTEDITLTAQWRINKVNKIPIYLNGKVTLTQPYILDTDDKWKKVKVNIRYNNEWVELIQNPANFE